MIVFRSARELRLVKCDIYANGYTGKKKITTHALQLTFKVNCHHHFFLVVTERSPFVSTFQEGNIKNHWWIVSFLGTLGFSLHHYNTICRIQKAKHSTIKYTKLHDYATKIYTSYENAHEKLTYVLVCRHSALKQCYRLLDMSGPYIS